MTGIVALYRNGPGPVVMVRTELDALPLAEKTGLPYASKARQMLRGVETPVMHACNNINQAWNSLTRSLTWVHDTSTQGAISTAVNTTSHRLRPSTPT